MGFGVKTKRAAGAAAKTPAAKRAREAPREAEEAATAKKDAPRLAKAMSASDLLCDEVVVEGGGGRRTITDLHCYETLGRGMAPCRLVRLPSAKAAEPKGDSGSPSPVDTTAASTGSWWDAIDSPKRPPAMVGAPAPKAQRLEREYHHVQGLFTQAASNRHAPPSSDSAKQRIASGVREMQLDEYPVDWSIKTFAKITCRRPFDFGGVLPSATESRALLSFVRGASGAPQASAQGLYKSSLLQWRHPAQKIPQPLVGQFAKFIAGGGRGGGGSSQDEWARTRVAEWEDAFHSLYHMLRQQECEYFYYIGPLFTVLFVAGSEGAPTRAYLTNSTKSLRKKIDAENIEYTLPHAGKVGAGAPGDRTSEREELRMLQRTSDLHVRETSDLGFVDGGADSLMSFQGQDAVHGLFDFLQSRPHDKDVPELVSPAPFLHANLKQLRVRDSRALSGAIGAVPGSEVFSLEVEGIIMPCALRSLLAALRQQQGSFTAAFKTDSRTVALNVDQGSGLGEGGQRAVVYSARCMDEGVYMVSTSANG